MIATVLRFKLYDQALLVEGILPEDPVALAAQLFATSM